MNLLLISIDSLRVDYAHHAAGSCVQTPRFARVSEGFGFSQRCFSVSSATRPVHTSLLTGLYPFEHGILGQQDQQIRAGAAQLLRQCEDDGKRAGFLSEAPEIFTGLDLGAPVRRLSTAAGQGVAQAQRWLDGSGTDDSCLLLHYWSAHTPYGAADGKALGETAELLRQGRVVEVRQRYQRAVEDVFDNKVAPLLEGLDLGRWAVLLFGDHGESWTPDEFYHGTSVRNRVLRVPLYLHIPYSGNTNPGHEGVVSLVDTYATACSVLGLERKDQGFGVSWTDKTASNSHPYRLAQIRPGRDAGEDRLDAPSAWDSHARDNQLAAERWCLFDHQYRLHGEGDSWQLEHQWSEDLVAGDVSGAAAPYLAAHSQLLQQSRWSRRPLAGATDARAEETLRRRLLDLGYL